MKSARIPVWLVTGYLGSGKTTLLARWLRDPALADVALIINEIGEVGFDNQFLASSVDSASSLVANQCICCNGLPGLQEALAELWWARLRRERPHFGSVVIETTGLADPRSLVEAFESVSLLRERYVLQAVITAVSAVVGQRLIEAHDEARAQVAEADVVVVTKADSAPAEPLAEWISLRNPRARMLLSAQASVEWPEVMATIGAPHASVSDARHERHEHEQMQGERGESGHVGAHVHGAESRFFPYSAPVALDAWPLWLGPLLCSGLQRLKGVVRLDDGTLISVQWSEGDASPAFVRFVGNPPSLGLTSIRL